MILFCFFGHSQLSRSVLGPHWLFLAAHGSAPVYWSLHIILQDGTPALADVCIPQSGRSKNILDHLAMGLRA